MMRNWWIMCLVGGLLAAGGCTVGPDYAQPTMELPDQWNAEGMTGTADAVTLQRWWMSFDDPVLTSLIERADANNPDLRAALARIDQSRALRAYAAGENLPSVDVTGSYRRERSSGSGFMVIPGENSFYTAGFDAFWEMDLFGRIRRSVESAQASLEQSVEDYRDARVTLFAEVARNYIELRTLQVRIGYALANIEIQRKTLDLTQSRYEARIVPALDVSQAKLNLANSESEIPLLRSAEAAAVNRLAVLLGTTPHTLRQELTGPGALPNVQTGLTVGVPAELLRRRPDIRSAERALAAQTARIGIAEALRYPSLSLNGTLGLQAMQFSDMGDWNSRYYAFGPGVRWSLFDGNRLKSLAAVEEARTRQLAAAYESAVLRAVEEVENAMVGWVQEQQRAASLQQSVEAARQSVEMVDALYRSGLTDFENVLLTQRSLSLQEDRLAVSQGIVLQQMVVLYKALGGGWEESPN